MLTRLAPLALALTLTSPALAERGRFEVGLTTEGTALTGATIGATTSTSVTPSPGIHIGYAITPLFTVQAGWRGFTPLSRGDSGFTLTTDPDSAFLALRMSYPLTPWFHLDAQLDLEGLHARTSLDLGTTDGETTAWAFGAVPRLGVTFRIDLTEGTFLDLRAYGGFALRTDLDASGIRLSGDPGPSRVPLDLGAVNLSGAVFGITAAVLF